MSERVHAVNLTGYDHHERGIRFNIPSIMTVSVFYTIIFGPHPFAQRMDVTDLTAAVIPAYYWGIYIFTNLLVVYVFLQTYRINTLRLLSGVLYLLLGWAFISLLWSDQVQIGIFRYTQLVIISLSALTIVNAMGPERTLDVLAKFLFFTAAVDWISIAVIPQAIHLFSENDSNLIGSWRGLHIHKNIAAPLMVISCLLFLTRLIEKRHLFDLVGFLLSVGFLLGTNSRTSIGFLGVAGFVLLALHLKKTAPPILGVISVTVFSAVFIIAVILFYANYEVIKAYLSDPSIFSGRGGLWGIIMILSDNYDFMGYGYGSFWRVGINGISYEYATGWHASSFNGHNGYLDMLITLGWIGFWLGIAAFVIEPVLFFLSRSYIWNSMTKTALTMIIFVALHNLLESTLLMWNADTYFIWLLAACILRYPYKKVAGH